MSSKASLESDLQAGRRQYAGLAVLALAALLMSLDLSVLYLALPHLSTALGASSTEQLWVVDIYGFMLAGFLITMGTIGDRVGRRRLLLTGAVAFGLASVLAAFSVSVGMLLVARAMMGIAGATVMPCGLGLISHMFKNPAQRGMAIALWMSCFMGGLLIGPVIGGVLLQFFWWGSVFLLAVPVMLLLLIVGPMVLPEFRNPQAGRLDLTSVALSLAGILPVIYGIKELANDGWTPVATTSIVVGLGLGTLFVLRQRRLTDPVLDLGLFRIPIFAAAVVFGLLGGAVQGGSSLLVVLYMQMVEGLSTLRTGLWMLPATFFLIVGVMLGPVLAQRIRPAYVLASGMVIATVGYLILSQVESAGGLPRLLVGFSVILLGVGIPLGLVTGLAVGAAPPEKVGSASASMQTGSEFGVALGIACLGSVATAVYRGNLANNLPDGSAEVGNVAATSIEAAVAAAQSLPAPLNTELLQAAREAFTAGFNVVAIIGAVVVIGLAALSVATLRQLDPVPGAQPTDQSGGPTQADDADAGPAMPGAVPSQETPSSTT